MKKSSQYAKNGALIIGLGSGLLNIVKQLDEMDKNPDVKFQWKELLFAGGKGAIVGGVGGFAVGWFLDHQNSNQIPIDLDKYFNDLSSSLMLKKDTPEFIKLKAATERITKELKKHFCDKMSGDLIAHGSTVKGTALEGRCDLDFAVPFKPKSFLNNTTMYLALLAFFEERIGELNIVEVREQKRSIGVCIRLKHNEYWIDFAPYKLTKESGSAGYLFVNKKGLFIDESTIQKTDLSKLKTKFSNSQKKLIIILKDWKERHNLPLPSHFLEHLVLDAYEVNRGAIPHKFSHKLIMVLKHISERLDIIYISGRENTNNIISKSIDNYAKRIIMEACTEAIKEFEYQPNSLTKIFRLA